MLTTQGSLKQEELAGSGTESVRDNTREGRKHGAQSDERGRSRQNLPLGRTKTYELIARGVLPAIRTGQSVRVPKEALEAWVHAQLATYDGLNANP
jgi:excisionase family DNA binding protein